MSRRTAPAGTGRNPARREESTLLIDATLKHNLPPLALPAREFMEHAREIWDELGLPASPAGAVARLFARRLGRPFRRQCPPRNWREMG